MAIAMALFLKHFVIEAYKIPSGSMQPTLIGDEDADIKDRILVDKLSYAFRDPRRWEVAVFRYPLDPEVYPVDYLPFALSWIDVAGPAAAALIICALASGPVALVASRLPLLAGLGRA